MTAGKLARLVRTTTLTKIAIILERIGIPLTFAVSIRTSARLGRPAARPFVSEHW